MLTITQMTTGSARQAAPVPSCPPVRAHMTLRARAWWVMRAMATWSVNDLLMVIAGAEDRSARNNLTRYIASLQRFGVVGRIPASRPARWRVCLDLGPLAPVISRIGGFTYLIDPNSGTSRDPKENV